MGRSSRRSAKKKTPEIIGREIRAEIRSIMRRFRNLCEPLGKFEPVMEHQESKPRYYVVFDGQKRRPIKGLKMRVSELELPDERITDEFLGLASSLWHLKDRIRQWVKSKQMDINIQEYVLVSRELQICADLANTKKHGASENVSGLNPDIGLVRFDMNRSGVIELYYDGATKEKEVIVSETVPIPFRISVQLDGGHSSIPDGIEILRKSFTHWLPLLNQVGLLSGDDSETVALREKIKFEVAQGWNLFHPEEKR